MLTLYPPIRPYSTHQLAVDDVHTLYVEESGNPNGMPAVFLHGGPGVGSFADNRRFFDPAHYRIIVFDQRGAGQSTPHAELTNNTTQKLVSDMEAIREHLQVDKWMLFGGSWGSTLALVYAETHPERVSHLILRGIFLCRPEDIAWFYAPGGASRLFPDYWEDFIGALSEKERAEILQSYYARLTGKNELVRLSSAKAWSEWEGRCSTLDPNPALVDVVTQSHIALSMARTEAHYFMHDSFLQPNQILKNAHRLENISGVIVHGRYDAVCPVDGAYELHKVWPNSELQIVRDAGHSSGEPGITHALVRATNRIVKLF